MSLFCLTGAGLALEQITFRRNRFAIAPEGVNLLYLIDVERIHTITPIHEMVRCDRDPL